MHVLRFIVDATALLGAYWLGLKAFDDTGSALIVVGALACYSLFVYVDGAFALRNIGR